MNISLDWINEFVELPQMDADDFANSFTMTTAEVEGVKTTFTHLSDIKVAQIQSIRKHPEADKLNLVTFDMGSGSREVVCGAPNVREGLKVPYAPIGVTLPNGLTLEPKIIRGILSEGMLCSETELGTGEGSSGLMELSSDAQVGQTMIDYLKLKADTILDVDNKSLTHRPDLWGHFGLAREFAAAYEKELKSPFDSQWKSRIEESFSREVSPIVPKVEKDSSCLAYWGISLDGIKVADSPRWMQARLEACGMRPINNIVDISNYVMLELGIPNHIFDRKLISNNTIHIKRVANEQSFTTLDEIERKLIPSDTVICDSEKPLVIAGLMGGANSGVSESTTSIFIEVANWKASEVRSTSTRLGLRTDSSTRYEKSLDSQLCYRTLLRLVDFIQQVCPDAKVIGKPEYDGESLEFEPLVIETSLNKVKSVLGYELRFERLSSIFQSLDFSIEGDAEKLKVSLPSYRTTKDIENEADLIEEVGRMIGYDNINPTSPLTDIQTTRLSSAKVLSRKIQDFMMMNKSLEVMTYPLIGKKLLEKANWPTLNEDLVLVNALSQDADRMRPSLIPHALQTFSVNAKKFDSFSFFELGRSYLPDPKDFFKEQHQVLIGMYNKNENIFLKLLNTVEGLLNYLQIPFDLTTDLGKFNNPIIDKDWKGNHPHEFINIKIMGKFQGGATSIHPMTLRDFKVKGNACVAVLDITSFQDRPIKDKTKYTPIAKFPASTFDCTVLLNKKEDAANVLTALKKLKIKELTDYKIRDVFDLNESQNAVTIKVTFEDPNKTLSPEFIKDSENAVVDCLDKAGYPLKV